MIPYHRKQRTLLEMLHCLETDPEYDRDLCQMYVNLDTCEIEIL